MAEDAVWSSNPAGRVEVGLYTSPWVSGTRVGGYFGPISAELFLADGELEELSEAWEKAELELLEALRAKVRALGGNAGVGLEVTADPWSEGAGGRPGLRLHAVCTAARLEPLW